ncbi:MAG: hypothetical protein FWE97_02455, partial [Dehalococcoidia bacterium]|nr:hypothetical protein [Dehalococcoidia bacterium]
MKIFTVTLLTVFLFSTSSLTAVLTQQKAYAAQQIGTTSPALQSPMSNYGLTMQIEKIVSGDSHTIALMNDESVWAWGLNTNGQLGNGTTISSNTPVQVSGLTNVTAIAAGGTHNLAIRTDGTVRAWGNNLNGQLGDGTTTQRATPVQVSGLTNVTAIAAGSNHSLATKSDGTVFAWGLNSSGQLGNGTTADSNTPVQVSGLTSVTAVAAGSAHSLARRSNGAVWAWGLNGNGQLGDGTTTSSNAPVQVSGLTNVTAVAAGDSHSFSVKSDGTAYAWGLNSSGQLGDETITERYIPVQASGLTGVTMIAAGGAHSLALKAYSFSSVLACGSDEHGQLGLGRLFQSNIPIMAVFEFNQIVFDQPSYSLAIPLLDSPAATITVSAAVLDMYGTIIPNAVITYGLDASYTGVSINSSTGVVTVDSSATPNSVELNVGLTASCNGLTSYSVLCLTSLVGQPVFAQPSYTLSVPAALDPSKTLTVSAAAINPLGNIIPNAVITYGLDNSYIGVSINSSTGVITVAHTASAGSIGLTASYSGLTGQAVLNLIPTAVDQLIFEYPSYTLSIPASGAIAKTVAVNAAALDPMGKPITTAVFTYGLDASYTGVSIDSSTGVITVDSTAAVGSIGLTAFYNGITIQAVLYLITYSSGEELLLNVTEGKLYTVSAWAYDIEDFDGLVFVLTYDPQILEMSDLSAFTWIKELTAGVIQGTGITILSFIPGEVIFSIDHEIPSGMSWSGITNSFVFKALDTGSTTVTISQAASNSGSSSSSSSSSGEVNQFLSMTALSAEQVNSQDDKSSENDPENYKKLPYDEKAFELMGRMSEYNNFSDEDKLYIQNYLGIYADPTEEELAYFAELEARAREISPEVILLYLLDGTVTFDSISPEDWAKAEKYFSNLSSEQINSLSAKGLSARGILQINLAMRYGMFDAAEAEQLVILYPDDIERNELVFELYLCTGTSEIIVRESAKTMILSGAEMDAVKESLNLSAETGIKGIIIDSSLLNGNNSSSTSSSGGTPQNTQYDPIAPFSIDNGSGERIDLNSGNLSYWQDILNIPGVNGLDLNLSIIYNSSNTALYEESYKSHQWAVYWFVEYEIYCYLDGVVIEIYDGVEGFSSYNASQKFIADSKSYWPYEDQWADSGQEYATDQWDNVQLIAEDMFNPGYFFVVEDNPHPTFMSVSYDDGSYRYSGLIYVSSGTNLTYYSYEDWDTYGHLFPNNWPAYCSRITQIWTTYYAGNVDSETKLDYEEKLHNCWLNSVYDYQYYNFSYDKDDNTVFGAGWNWNLPYIETVNNSDNVLHLGNGRSYTIGSYNSSTQTYALNNYTLKDITLKRHTAYNNGQYTSFYVLEYANGDKTYFSQSGLLMAQADRYGNTITYKYASFGSYSVLSQIIDTGGRIINFAYANTQTGRTVTITAPDNTQIIITIDKISGKNYTVKSVTDAKGNQVTFNYTLSSSNYNRLCYDDYYPDSNCWVLLTEVVYPTQAKKVFTYSIDTNYFGDYGFSEFYRLGGRKDVVGNVNYNVKTYSYAGSSTGGGQYDPNDLPSYYTYSATITDGNINGSTITTTYVFNNKHLLVSETVKNNNVTVSVTEYAHNADKLPVSVTRRLYNSSNSYMESIMLYEYDNKGNITAFWNERANGNKANTDFKTTITYDSNFNLPTSRTYKQDASTTISEVYTLTPDNKAVSTLEIKVNNVVKAKTQFLYNLRGEVAEKRDFKDGFVNYVETFYTYDIYGNLTSIVNLGITAVSGNLVAGTPGNGSIPGRLAVVFAYDIMGRLIISTDANGNVTGFQYDAIGRVIKVVNADST